MFKTYDTFGDLVLVPRWLGWAARGARICETLGNFSRGHFGNSSTLVQVAAWHRMDAKPFPKTMMIWHHLCKYISLLNNLNNAHVFCACAVNRGARIGPNSDIPSQIVHGYERCDWTTGWDGVFSEAARWVIYFSALFFSSSFFF